AIGMGFIFGPGIGGLLAGGSLSLAYFMTTFIILATSIFAIFKIKETYKQTTEVRKKITLPTEYFLQPVGILLVCTFFIMFINSGLESTFQLLGIDRISITPAEMGILFFIGGIFNAIVQEIGRALCRES